MAQKTYDLKTYSLSNEDINLITHALRQLIENASFSTIRHDAVELLNYIEREKKENGHK